MAWVKRFKCKRYLQDRSTPIVISNLLDNNFVYKWGRNICKNKFFDSLLKSKITLSIPPPNMFFFSCLNSSPASKSKLLSPITPENL